MIKYVCFVTQPDKHPIRSAEKMSDDQKKRIERYLIEHDRMPLFQQQLFARVSMDQWILYKRISSLIMEDIGQTDSGMDLDLYASHLPPEQERWIRLLDSCRAHARYRVTMGDEKELFMDVIERARFTSEYVVPHICQYLISCFGPSQAKTIFTGLTDGRVAKANITPSSTTLLAHVPMPATKPSSHVLLHVTDQPTGKCTTMAEADRVVIHHAPDRVGTGISGVTITTSTDKTSRIIK